jgi:membrane dipeptidase
MDLGNAIGGYLEGMREHHSVVVGDEAKGIHEKSLVIDLHNDVLLYVSLYGFNLNKRHSAPRYFNPFRPLTDIPRLREGGVSGLGLGIATLPFLRARGAKLRWMWRMMDAMNNAVDSSSGDLILACSAEDLIMAKKEGKVTVFPGLEGLHIIEGDISILEKLKELQKQQSRNFEF